MQYHEHVVIRALDNGGPVDCVDVAQVDIILYFDAPSKNGTKIIKPNDLEKVKSVTSIRFLEIKCCCNQN